MNRSGKGFGLTGVAVAVAVMIVMAVFSTSSQATTVEFKTVLKHSVDLNTNLESKTEQR